MQKRLLGVVEFADWRQSRLSQSAPLASSSTAVAPPQPAWDVLIGVEPTQVIAGRGDITGQSAPLPE